MESCRRCAVCRWRVPCSLLTILASVAHWYPHWQSFFSFHALQALLPEQCQWVNVVNGIALYKSLRATLKLQWRVHLPGPFLAGLPAPRTLEFTGLHQLVTRIVAPTLVHCQSPCYCSSAADVGWQTPSLARRIQRLPRGVVSLCVVTHAFALNGEWGTLTTTWLRRCSSA